MQLASKRLGISIKLIFLSLSGLMCNRRSHNQILTEDAGAALKA
jgi:hypothetical protein